MERKIIMPKRGENIRKRKDGRWEGRYKVNTLSGEKLCSVYGKSYSDCKEKLLYCKSKPSQKTASHNSKEKSFEEILRLWLLSNKVKNKGSTEHKYMFMIERHIIPQLGKIKISQLTSVIINQFLDNKLLSGNLNNSKGLSPSYVRTLSIIISSSLKFAINEGYCQNCVYSINKPSIGKKDLQILTREAQDQFECLISNSMDNIKLGALIALHTGLRIGEICALNWNDIDLKNRVIHIRHTISRIRVENNKTKLIIDNPKTESSNRDIPISSALFPILTQMKSLSLSDYVVSNTSGFMSTRTFDYKYKKMLKECGLVNINFHALRHTFATRCVESGVDIKTLSEVLGHSSVSTTLDIYVHSSLEIKRIQLEKLYSNNAA